jgi:hypothetical protein
LLLPPPMTRPGPAAGDAGANDAAPFFLVAVAAVAEAILPLLLLFPHRASHVSSTRGCRRRRRLVLRRMRLQIFDVDDDAADDKGAAAAAVAAIALSDGRCCC